MIEAVGSVILLLLSVLQLLPQSKRLQDKQLDFSDTLSQRTGRRLITLQ
jgi:hypothetical protein